MKTVNLLLAAIFLSTASPAQIAAPADFICKEGFMTNGTIVISEGNTRVVLRGHTSSQLRDALNRDNDVWNGSYTISADGLVVGTGVLATAQQGASAGYYFCRVFSPDRWGFVTIASRVNDQNFRNLSAWAIRSVRDSGGLIALSDHKGRKCVKS